MSDIPDSGVTLSPAQFAEAFPFHIVFDSSFRVLSAGRSIGRVHPGLAPGVIVTDVFELVAFSGATPEQLAEVRDRPILMRSTHSGTQVRGQVFRTGSSFVFVGSPWAAAGDSLAQLGLSLRDFAIHDSTPDLVDLVQAHLTAVDEVRDREARMRAILETSLDAIVTIDERGDLVEFNAAAERIFGWRRQDTIGRPMAELIVPPQHRDAHRSGMERHLRTGDSKVLGRRLELTALRADGSEFPVELTITRIQTSGGPLFSGHIRDITERVEAQRQLLVARDAAEAANRAKSDFLAAISHELRTPLHIITGTTELLYGSSLEEGHRESLEAIRGQSETLLYLIDQILDVGKIEAGRIALEEIEVDPRLLVETLTDSLQIHARDRGITLQSVVGPRVPGLVRMDGFRFQQIVTNLVTNAIKFTPMGQVDVHLDVTEVTAETASLDLRVIDTGVGVPPDRFGDIFQPFVQLDPTSTRKVGGAGLGLSITRYLVEAMGGRIWVESELGKGSTFHVELDVPVADPEPRASGAGPLRLASAPSAESVGRILVVDDHELGRRMTRRLLETAGHQVVEAASAAEAIDILASTRVDLVFMDVEMPVMNGLDATRLIREGEVANESKRTPVIGLSAHAIEGVRARGLEAGMDGYVTKPIKRADLLACVKEWLSLREPDMEAEHTSSTGWIDVTVDPDIADLVPAYLEHVRSLAKSIEPLAVQGSWQEIRVIGHNLKGSGAPHGLWEISRLGGDIQRAIDAGNTEIVVTLARQLVDYVSKVRIS